MAICGSLKVLDVGRDKGAMNRNEWMTENLQLD